MTSETDLRAVSAGSLEQESELLPTDPPPAATRVLATFLIALFVAIALFVVLVPLPATVTGRFVLKPEGGANPVNAPQAGVVERVEVKVGSQVEEGDVLLVLRSDQVREMAAEQARLRLEVATAREKLVRHLTDPESAPGAGNMSSLRARVRRLEREQAADLLLDEELASQHENLLEAARSDLAAAEAEVESRRMRYESLKEMEEQAQALAEENYIAKKELLQQREEQADALADLQEARRGRSKARMEIQTLVGRRQVELRQRSLAAERRAGELSEARAALEEQLTELGNTIDIGTKRLAALDRSLPGVEGSLLEVRAPFDGSVYTLDIQRPGVSVERGAKLCEIARADAKVYAAITVPERGVGRVVRGQPVRLLLDAYPHTRHGARRAQLTWVSPAAKDGKLPAIAVLEQSTIIVDGEARPLGAGLQGEARIDTGLRTLLQFVLEPLRQIKESYKQAAGGPREGP